jgi:hypothetical protein
MSAENYKGQGSDLARFQRKRSVIGIAIFKGIREFGRRSERFKLPDDRFVREFYSETSSTVEKLTSLGETATFGYQPVLPPNLNRLLDSESYGIFFAQYGNATAAELPHVPDGYNSNIIYRPFLASIRDSKHPSRGTKLPDDFSENQVHIVIESNTGLDEHSFYVILAQVLHDGDQVVTHNLVDSKRHSLYLEKAKKIRSILKGSVRIMERPSIILPPSIPISVI